jgi:sugar phosphate isomerase/epimerase
MTRRDFQLAALAALAPASVCGGASRPGRRMGIVVHSYSLRWRGRHSSVRFPPFRSVLDLFDHARETGAAGVQASVAGWEAAQPRRVRETCEAYGMYFEGSIVLPKSEGDVARFEREMRQAQEAGARVLRSALGGRRYEMFSSLQEFRQFKDGAWRAMQLAEPAARHLGMRIGVENHKDFHAAELVEMIQKLGSEHMGATIDTGNSIALLEDPMEVVETLAPFAVTTHIKDMAVQECEDGFLLSEVPVGEGMLDLDRMLQVIEARHPGITFNLEMITRDPLRVPCLTERFFASFPEKPAAALARTLALVRKNRASSLPSISDKTPEAALALEEENVLKSLRAGVHKLGLDYRVNGKEIIEGER